MIIKYYSSEHEPELFLEPNSDYDHELLERLERECLTKGMGRHCDTGKLLHVRIALEPVICVFPESMTEL